MTDLKYYVVTHHGELCGVYAGATPAEALLDLFRTAGFGADQVEISPDLSRLVYLDRSAEAMLSGAYEVEEMPRCKDW